MKKKFILFFLIMFVSFNLVATKRTIPVDMIIMIDKSLSMDEIGKFDSLKSWVLDELIGQMVIEGDWISIYQFYENPEHLISMTVNNNNKQNIINTIDSIKPNGKFTDIGKALDEINFAATKREANNRYKVLLIITDLEQDAPITSRYSGKQKKFKSPYLVESRIIKHNKWYEITLDMSIQDRVVETTKELFSDIKNNKDAERTKADEEEALIKNKEKGN